MKYCYTKQHDEFHRQNIISIHIKFINKQNSFIFRSWGNGNFGKEEEYSDWKEALREFLGYW